MAWFDVVWCGLVIGLTHWSVFGSTLVTIYHTCQLHRFRRDDPDFHLPVPLMSILSSPGGTNQILTCLSRSCPACRHQAGRSRFRPTCPAHFPLTIARRDDPDFYLPVPRMSRLPSPGGTIQILTCLSRAFSACRRQAGSSRFEIVVNLSRFNSRI